MVEITPNQKQIASINKSMIQAKANYLSILATEASNFAELTLFSRFFRVIERLHALKNQLPENSDVT